MDEWTVDYTNYELKDGRVDDLYRWMDRWI